MVFVHGAANSSIVWTIWQRELSARGWSSFAIDLRGHGENNPSLDLSSTTMENYADDIASFIGSLPQRPVLIGWSMGGLACLMVAAENKASACVVLAPSMPARTLDSSVELRRGEFDASEYGITSLDPLDQPAMADLDIEERTIALPSLSKESRLARDERKLGILINKISCPLLLVTGSADGAWPEEVYKDLWLEHTKLPMDGASHWGLVLNRRALSSTIPKVLAWLENALAQG